MEIRIYQIKDEKFETCKYAFFDYDFAKKMDFSFDDYEEVYSYFYVPQTSSLVLTEEDKFRILEKVFRKFNVERPEDFTGHSISSSDIVSLDDELYYCNALGWVKI